MPHKPTMALAGALVASCLAVASTARAEAPLTLIAVGGAPETTASPTLQALKRRLKNADPERTAVVFTGNHAPKPLPEPGHPDRARVESAVMRHVDAVRDFVGRGGRVMFLPGHKDYQAGPASVRRLRKLVDDNLARTTTATADLPSAFPIAACGEPRLVKFGPDDAVVLAFLNSQWWMQDFSADPETNQGCRFKNRGQLATAVNDIVKRWRAKRLVFLAHHPLESFGPFGGRFPLSTHMSPPLLGSLVIWAKQAGLAPQHRRHVLYDTYSGGVFAAAQKFGGFTFVSGHDRSLQAFRIKDQVQIVSGTAGKTSRVVRPPNGHAARAAGWAELTLGTPDQDQARFIEQPGGRELFAVPLPQVARLGSDDLGPAPVSPEGPVTSTYAEKKFDETGWLKGFFLGRHYRDAYSLELEFSVFDLEAEGFEPFSAGGGNQTNSLFLFGPQEGQWVARSTTKDASRFLPYPLNQLGFVNALLEDAFTATHPQAATSIPAFADALGVYHSNPRLVYVPDQAALSPYRGFVSEEVALLEQRAKRPKEGSMPESYGEGDSPVGRVTFEGGDDVIDLLRENPWLHHVDQRAMLKARLLDIFIGDWDRHEDQWRFAKLNLQNGRNLYRPVPEDRDQAFANYDGFALAMARIVLPQVRVLRPFKKRIRGLTWLIYGSRHFDPVMLNRMSKDAWMEVAKEVQQALTDEVIAEGMRTWPEPAYEMHGAEIERKLRRRREDLLDRAEAYYSELNRQIDVLGSEQDDEILISFQKKGRVRVAIRRSKDPQNARFFDRVFVPGETKEIRLYALAGDDRLRISGEPHKKIRIRFVAGAGQDEVASDDGLARRAKAIRLYDQPDGATIEAEAKVKDRRSNSPYRNQYDRYDPHNEPFTMAFVPKLAFNPDDGLALGGTVIGTFTGFKRSPFASRHSLSAEFTTATLGAAASYDVLFPNTLGPLDQGLGIRFTTPRFTRNFFGVTNLYVDPRDIDRDFFRVRQLTGEVYYGPSLRLASDLIRIGLEVTAELIDVENTEGRFLRVASDVDPEAFADRYFVGGRLRFAVDSRASQTYPKRGLTFEATAAVRSDLTGGDLQTFANFTGTIGTHLPIDRTGRLVLTSRVRAEHTEGDFPFYFFPTLGANDLRAFNDEQFAGTTVFAQTTDLRLELFEIRRVLPGNIGIAGSIDHGRVFGDGVDTSDPALEADTSTYHVSAGGTLFWNLFGLFGVTGSYHRGVFDDTERVVIGLGPQFTETGFVGD